MYAVSPIMLSMPRALFVHNGQHSTLGNTMVQRPSVKSQADNTNQKEGLEMLRQSFPGAADDGWYGAFRLNGSTRSPISPTETHNAPHQHKRQISPNYVFPSLAAEISEDLDDFDQSMIGRLPNFRAAGFHQDPSRRRDFLLVDPNLFLRTGPREPLQQWQQRPGVPVDR
ncbi:unnamed protein product [Clonostachys rosea f. rosea IK726]|uniref:Uncharacterized protein n=1 Tax=Clonostachys rosea f. rosea IK726 TaxID=1349383 RepID=A0ACA9URH8_BIOOC|nr:unnamed protein product [Clonostachys rosea f. rosea IK726]